MVKALESVPARDHVMVSVSSSRAVYVETVRSTAMGSASHSISSNEGVAWVGPVLVISGVSSTLVTVTVTSKVPVLVPVLPF